MPLAFLGTYFFIDAETMIKRNLSFEDCIGEIQAAVLEENEFDYQVICTVNSFRHIEISGFQWNKERRKYLQRSKMCPIRPLMQENYPNILIELILTLEKNQFLSQFLEGALSWRIMF